MARTAAVERVFLRLVYVACPLLLLEVPGRYGYLTSALIAGAAQFAGSARSALRDHASQEAAYVRVGSTLARASAMVPLPLPEVEPELALGRALYAHTRLVTDIVPAIYGEGAALALAVGVIACTPFRLLLVPLVAAVVVALIAYVPFHRAVRRREDTAYEAVASLHSHLILFLSERVERVAQGADTLFLRELSQRGRDHRRAALLATAARTLLRRVPLALATLVAWVAVEKLQIIARADAVLLLMALAIVAGANALLSSISERAQLEVDATPFMSLMSLRDASLGGREPVGACARIIGRDVSFSYDGSREVVSEFSFEIAPNKPLVLRGENGSGKSTVLKLILGLGEPTSGDISVDGKSLRELDTHAWHAQIAFVSQATPFDANADVQDAMRAIDPELSDDALARALADLGLTPARDWLTRKMGALSSGQRRRVQLARAFALDRRVLILDEPEAGLDGATQDRVRDLVMRASKERLVVVATHSDLFDEGIRLSRSRDTAKAATALA